MEFAVFVSVENSMAGTTLSQNWDSLEQWDKNQNRGENTSKKYYIFLPIHISLAGWEHRRPKFQGCLFLRVFFSHYLQMNI